MPITNRPCWGIYLLQTENLMLKMHLNLMHGLQLNGMPREQAKQEYINLAKRILTSK